MVQQPVRNRSIKVKQPQSLHQPNTASALPVARHGSTENRVDRGWNARLGSIKVALTFFSTKGIDYLCKSCLALQLAADTSEPAHTCGAMGRLRYRV